MNTISDNQSTINWYQQIKNAQDQKGSIQNIFNSGEQFQ